MDATDLAGRDEHGDEEREGLFGDDLPIAGEEEDRAGARLLDHIARVEDLLRLGTSRLLSLDLAREVLNQSLLIHIETSSYLQVDAFALHVGFLHSLGHLFRHVGQEPLHLET